MCTCTSQELVEYLEFKCKVPRAKGVIKEIRLKLKEAKTSARQEKDKAMKKEKKAYVKVVKVCKMTANEPDSEHQSCLYLICA